VLVSVDTTELWDALAPWWALDGDRRVGNYAGTASTGRRALELLPQRAFCWRRGSFLSVIDVAGRSSTPRRWGTRVCEEEACL
jgi:hypothetical protein